MAKTNYKRITSPRGEALYPHLKTPEVYDGQTVGYTIQAKFSKEATDKLIEQIENELEAAKKSDIFIGKRWYKEPHLGFREDKNGDIVFKFKTKHEITTKAGDVIKRTVPVFDAKGKPIDVSLGNGSVVRIAFQVVPYHKSSTNNGVTLYLDAIQVIELVEYNGSSQDASGFGFEEEEGYVANQAASRFDDDDHGDIDGEDEGDF